MAHCETCSCSLLALKDDARGSQDSVMFEEIDKEIYRLQATIIALRTRRNALLSTGRLPPELLCLIFKRSHDPTDGAQHANITQSLRISHVCKQWRQIALDEARMWDYADFERLTLAKEVLQRSKAVPLEVSLELIRSLQSDEQIIAVAPHIPHLHRLTLHAHPRFVVDMEREWTLPSGLLQDIRIIPYRSISYRSSDSVRLYGDLGEDFFVAAWAHIHLLLDDDQLDWRTPLFSSSLRILEVCKYRTMAPAFKDMLAALVRMPNLETLTLDCALPDDATEYLSGLAPTPGRITLDHLKTLKLLPTVTMNSALSLLHRITLPAECSLHFDLNASMRSRNYVRHEMLHQEMASLLRAHIARPVTGVGIDVSSDCLRFILRNSHSDGEVLLYVRYSYDIAVSAALGQHGKLLSRLPATSLDIRSTFHVVSEIWSAALSQMQSVTDLRVHDTSTQILSALCESRREQGMPSSETTLLPLLSSLTIVDRGRNNRLGEAIKLFLDTRYGPDRKLAAPLRRLSVESPSPNTEAALNDLRASTDLEITTLI